QPRGDCPYQNRGICQREVVWSLKPSFSRDLLNNYGPLGIDGCVVSISSTFQRVESITVEVVV
ncbi:hypothetical protein, partial [Prochlorothrix hollandica]|uniref:hypothetical protein n=1 Tax=Prochlorothrix hollandica TaxID=1223 RepID=UPI003340BFEF